MNQHTWGRSLFFATVLLVVSSICASDIPSLAERGQGSEFVVRADLSLLGEETGLGNVRLPINGTGDTRLFRVSASGARWQSLPVVYTEDPQGAPGKIASDAVTKAFGAWDEQLSGDLFDHNTGVAPGTWACEPAGQVGHKPDGLNTVFWADISDAYPGALAVACVSFAAFPQSTVFLEFDMALNSTSAWDTGHDEGAPGYDVQSAVTHEVGHVLGLYDLYLSSAKELTMHGYLTPRDIGKRTLEAGDVAGLLYLYEQ